MLSGASSGASFSTSASTASGGNWLAVTPAAGVTPANVCISSAPQGLPLGNYSGTVTITGATATPLMIPVTLAVANGPLLSTNPQSLSFVLEVGGSLPAAQSVSVTSDVPSTEYLWLLLPPTDLGGNWLAVSPAQSSTPGTFTVSIKPVTLAPGVYTGNVVITSSTASNSPVKIPVTLTVPDIRLSVLPALLAFNYQIGCQAPGPLSLALSSKAVDGSPFSVGFTAAASSAGGNGGWLSIDSQAGATPGNINVSVNTNGISAGTYNGAVTVASAAASNSPQVVPVLLIASSPGLSLNPGSLTFNYQIGFRSTIVELSLHLKLWSTTGFQDVHSAGRLAIYRHVEWHDTGVGQHICESCQFIQRHLPDYNYDLISCCREFPEYPSYSCR